MNPTWLLLVLAAGGVLVAITRWASNVDADRKRFDADGKRFKAFMRRVDRRIKSILDRLPSPLATGGSPITLTELGRQIALAIEAGAWADELLPLIRLRAKGKEPFEVHQLCADFVEDLEYTPEQQRLLGRVAFEHGLHASQLPEVLIIILRDKLLELQESSPEVLAVQGLAGPAA